MTEAVDGLFVAQIAKNNWKNMRQISNIKINKLTSLSSSL